MVYYADLVEIERKKYGGSGRSNLWMLKEAIWLGLLKGTGVQELESAALYLYAESSVTSKNLLMVRLCQHHLFCIAVFCRRTGL